MLQVATKTCSSLRTSGPQESSTDGIGKHRKSRKCPNFMFIIFKYVSLARDFIIFIINKKIKVPGGSAVVVNLSLTALLSARSRGSFAITHSCPTKQVVYIACRLKRIVSTSVLISE